MVVFLGSTKLSPKAPSGKILATSSCYACFRDKVLLCLASACKVTFRDILMLLGTEQVMTIVESFFGNQEIQVLV